MQKDLIIIGGGPGGYVSAIRAAQLGMKVTLIEKNERMGGTCLNVGCIPTKSLLKSAHLYSSAGDLGKYGVEVLGATFNLEDAMNWKESVVARLTGGVAMLMKKNKIEVIRGEASLKDAKTVTVNGEELTFDNLIIAAGSEPAMPPIPGIDLPHVINSTGALSISRVPKRLAIIGGGVIAIEFASIFQDLGCEVTILEMMPEILPFIDGEVSTRLRGVMAKKGVTFHTSAKVTQVRPDAVVFEADGQTQEIPCDAVLAAAGRRPKLEGLGLDSAGIAYTKAGITVNESMRTCVPNIYAIGDVVPTPQLAHVASDEGIVAVETIAGERKRMKYNAIPSCVYTDPEVASVGLTEEEAKKQGIAYKTGKFPLAGNGKAMVEGVADGFVKVLCDEDGEELLGVHIMAPHASEMIFQASLALSMELSLDEFTEAIYPHPTISESVMEAALAAKGLAIHF